MTEITSGQIAAFAQALVKAGIIDIEANKNLLEE